MQQIRERQKERQGKVDLWLPLQVGFRVGKDKVFFYIYSACNEIPTPILTRSSSLTMEMELLCFDGLSFHRRVWEIMWPKTPVSVNQAPLPSIVSPMCDTFYAGPKPVCVFFFLRGKFFFSP